MSVKLKLFWITFILSCILRGTFSNQKGYYTIIAPATVLPESVFHVSFTLNDFHKSCWFNISITNYPERNKIYGLDGIEIKPGTTKLVELHAPSFNNTFGFLEIIGYRGIITKESEIIHLKNEKSHWAFVQTDKAKYKPGELVKFRVICIDQLTRPAKLNEEITVEIYNEEILLKTIHDVQFVQGVFRSEFQLSEHTILGGRRIKVLIGNRFLAYKDFEVVRYVLPKFNVLITNTKEVSTYDEQMVFEINASYFYGEPVRGNLSINVINYYAPYPEVVPSFTRELKIDGKSTIVLDLKKDLLVKASDDVTKVPAYALYTFNIEAIVTDELSEEQSRTSLEFGVHTKPYTIKLEAPTTFHADDMINLKVKVLISDLDGNLIENTKTPVEIIVGCHEKSFAEVRYDIPTTRIEYKKQDGKDFGMIQIANKNYSECFAQAEYEECISLRVYLKRKPTPFDMDILTESPQEGKELEVKIKNPEPIKEFSYEIVARGDIIQSDYLKVPGNATTFVFRFNVTSAMLPKITIFVHLIRNMGFVGHLKDVLIKRAFPNSIKITTTNETKPGESVSINVTTNEGSYVGLMGLDRSAYENLIKNKIFNEENVNWELRRVNSLNFYYHTPFYYRTEDIITFSNALPPGYGGGRGEDGPTEPLKPVREVFPESWLFMDFERTPAEGVNILETVPDSITTWALTGFSIHPENGLTFTNNATNLRVFQKFFVSFDLPSLVKDGEIIEVPVYINNYMNEDALTNVKIETNSEDLQILENPEASSKTGLNISMLISAKKREKLLIFLRPLNKGNYNVTVRAISSLASDAIRKTLNVQPQGIPYAMSKTYLVHLPEESIQENDITIDIPKNAVLGSERVEVSLVGDIFQPLMRNLEKLARVPYGNGEENMGLIVSNSIVLKYMKVLNYSIPSLENKIRENIELGYQNQLAFKYLDGSFGLFDGKKQRHGDIWQTVFSLWGLEQANEFIQIDPDVIGRGLDFLKSKQQENGCLKSKSGLEEDVKFTALGLMVFLMDENSISSYSEVISKGLEYLFEYTDDVEYSPVSAMATYALILGKHKKAEDHLKRLTTNTSLPNEEMTWTKSDSLRSYLETTAGCLVNLFESQEIPEQSILQIVRGLIVPKAEESSVTHMIALQAMIAFIEKLSLSKTNLNIVIKDDQEKSKDFQVNAENSQDLQTFEVSQNSRKINIQSKGHGFAVVDVKYYFNLIPEDKSSFYTMRISSKGISKYFGILKICSSAVTSNSKTKLTIMEVNLQSGYIFTEKDSQEDESKAIKAVKADHGGNKITVYFELLTNEVCIELEVRKSHNVFNSKPGWITVYDAHDKDQKSAKSFSINEF